jgi:hypothetical protein
MRLRARAPATRPAPAYATVSAVARLPSSPYFVTRSPGFRLSSVSRL